MIRVKDIQSKYKVDFDIATNFDKDFTDEIAGYGDFKWVYGKLNHDIVGGGRPSIRLPIISWEELEDYVAYCHERGIKFNYLLNALCLGGMELQKSFHEDVIELLKKLTEIKVDGVTVASPYLCEIIKEQFPHFYVSVSVYNKVQSIPPLKYWRDIGADEITLFHTANRDFNSLRRMLSYAKEIGLVIRLIANNSCLHECPFHANHAVTHAHGSKDDEQTRVFHIDYQVLNCNLFKIKNPYRIMASEWIRPEDIHYYEELCEEIGYEDLTIKLTERGRTSEWLLRTAKAYHNRSYQGNLLDIINYVGKGDFYGKLHDEKYWDKVEQEGYNKEMVKNYRESVFYKLPYVDNTKLDGFLKFFINNYQCDHKICDDSDYDVETATKDDVKGEVCSYCRNWAKRAITIDPQERERIIAKAQETLDNINSSRIFYREERG